MQTRWALANCCPDCVPSMCTPPLEPCPPTPYPCQWTADIYQQGLETSISAQIATRYLSDWEQVIFEFEIFEMSQFTNNGATETNKSISQNIGIMSFGNAGVFYDAFGNIANDQIGYAAGDVYNFAPYTLFPTNGGASKRWRTIVTRQGLTNIVDIDFYVNDVLLVTTTNQSTATPPLFECIQPVVGFLVQNNGISADPTGPGPLIIDVRNVFLRFVPDQCDDVFQINYPDYTTPGHTNNPSYNWSLNSGYASPESVTPNRVGGIDPVTYAVDDPLNLPTGWSINSSTGVISRPGAVLPVTGNNTFTVTATDNNGNTAIAPSVSWIQT